ncbi:EamA family transporter [Cellulomonas sp.]|uniref:DMT family transporter n=1 Tax=Cellulomonas sp. TaxID=40001 RepID=UPI002811388B|nr:EamA family transporter [Cellulomonas sp.]
MRAVLAVLLAALCFGTTGTAQALGPDADPVALGAARIAVGGLALAAVAAVVARRGRTGAAPAAGPGRPRGAAVTRTGRAVAVAVGAAGVLAYQPAFFLGTGRNGVAVGTVIALGSAPVVTGVLAWLLRRERPSAAWVLATALATAGVAVLGLAGPGDGGGGVDPVGVLGSLGAGAAYALYTLAGAALIDGGWTSTTSMGAVFGAAGAVSVPVLLVAGAGLLTTPAGLVQVAWLGLVTTTLAYVLFGYGLARLGAATVATLTLAEPLTATVLGLVVLHERLSPSTLVGLAVLAAGLVVLTAGTRRHPRPSAAPTPTSAPTPRAR